MGKLNLALGGVFLASLINPVVANAEGNGHVYLGAGINALALDNQRIFDVPTSSPGHAPKILSGAVGYRFSQSWATDLTFGSDVNSDVSADQLILNGYRFFGDKNWKPFVSGGLSSFGIDASPDDRTQQAQVGVGISGALTDRLEFRANYQLFGELGGESNTDRVFGISMYYNFGSISSKQVAAVPVFTPKPIPEPESVPEDQQVVDTYEILVEFDFDSFDILATYEPQISEIAEVLRRSPDISMTIEGHTDSIGSDEYNLSLSELRADAVKIRFVNDFSISSDRIDVIGYGETRPIGDNNTKEGRQKNRRAISVILEPRK
jgi:OOP family OmpA-OmpF porin